MGALAVVMDAAAQLMPADPLQSAAGLYVSAVRAMGTPYRGDDETIIRVREPDAGPDGDPTGPAGYVLVTLCTAGAASVCLVALRALTHGRGDGSRIMLTLCNLADYHGVGLTLVAAPLDHVGNRKAVLAAAARLVAWYGWFGFTGSFMGMRRKPARIPTGAK